MTIAGMFGDISGAVSDLLNAGVDTAKANAEEYNAQAALTTAAADRLKSQGDLLEGASYTEAATLAEQNAQYSAASTKIQTAQQDRQTFMAIGEEKAAVAGSGGTEGGSAGDILANSASQGALASAVLGAQGQISELGYKEQSTSYTNMASAATLASQQDILAAEGETDVAAGDQANAAGYRQAASYADIGAAIQGVAAVAALFPGA